MNNVQIYRKIQSLKKRVTRGFQVAMFPEQFYIYPKELYENHDICYSQEGEDLILSRFLERKKMGFYVDVGAHHPSRFSNTYKFYLNGWRGINIDAMPGSMHLFDRQRPRDINLEIAIAEKPQTLNYYVFNEPALNTFCQKQVDEYSKIPSVKIISTQEIETQTLYQVLDKYLPAEQTIDFLTIDVEGLDFQVLRSNNWQKYRPKIILVESLNTLDIDKVKKSDIAVFLRDKNYYLSGKTVNTLIFMEK